MVCGTRLGNVRALIASAVVTCASLLPLEAPYTWFSHDLPAAYLLMSTLMLLLLSAGEVLWAPSLAEYVAGAAPPGQEGAYSGMTALPWLAAKLVVSAASGYLLARWVPPGTGARVAAGTLSFWRSPAAMWLPVLAWVVASTAVLVCFRALFAQRTGSAPAAAREATTGDSVALVSVRLAS